MLLLCKFKKEKKKEKKKEGGGGGLLTILTQYNVTVPTKPGMRVF